MDLERIPEYLVLFGADATVSGNRLKWVIPSSYYNNQRAGVCYVSLADVKINDDYDGEILVKYHSGGQNQYSTKNSGAVLGGVDLSVHSGGSDTHYTYKCAERVYLLTNARPTTIELSLVDLNDGAVVATDAVFTLKFEYLNVRETAMELQTTYNLHQ